MKKIFILLLVSLLAVSFVSADSSHPEHTDFDQVEGIINAQIPCDILSEEQIELVGEYYMEQMHPGQAHVDMDEMMGGAGSSALKSAHMQIANKFYCTVVAKEDSANTWFKDNWLLLFSVIIIIILIVLLWPVLQVINSRRKIKK